MATLTLTDSNFQSTNNNKNTVTIKSPSCKVHNSLPINITTTALLLLLLLKSVGATTTLPQH